MKQIIDVVDDLRDAGDYPRRALGDITNIDIHHSADGRRTGMAAIEYFNQLHIDRGWPGIGYHYVGAQDGKIYKTGLDRQSRWSVGDHNGHTISYMLIGNFQHEDPTPEQYDSALWMVNRLRRAYGVPIIRAKGHNEYPGHSANVCPGIDMDLFRERLGA